MKKKNFHLNRVFLSLTLAFIVAFSLVAGIATFNLYKSRDIIRKLGKLEQNIFFPLSRAEEDIYSALLELRSGVSGNTQANKDFFTTFLSHARANLTVALEQTMELTPEESELAIPIKETKTTVELFEKTGKEAILQNRRNMHLRQKMDGNIDFILHMSQDIQNHLSASLLKIEASDPNRRFPAQGLDDISSLKIQLLEFKSCTSSRQSAPESSAKDTDICSEKIKNASFILDSLALEIPAQRQAVGEMMTALEKVEKSYQELLRSEKLSRLSLSRAVSLASELSTNLELCRQSLITFNNKMNHVSAEAGRTMTLWLLFSILFYLGILGLSARWLKKQVIIPLEEMNRSLEKIGQGQIVGKLPETRAEEIYRLSEQMALMTEQLKNREELLIDAKNKWESAFQAIGGPVVLLSPRYKVLECNQEFLKLVEANSLEEVTGKDFSEFFSDVEIERCCSPGGHLEKVKKGIRFEKKLKGRPFYLNASPVLDNKGNISAIIIVGTDLTEMKKLEERLRRAQKMEAMGTLAGGVAHDLNNILSGIVTYPDILLMQLPGNSPLAPPLKTIQKSGQRAADVVQDLLTLARRAMGTRKVLCLNTLIRDYLNSPECQKLLMENPGIKCRTFLSHDLLNIEGSPAHITKTIMNLFTNAVEAMPEGGEITISTKNLYLDSPLSAYDHISPGDYVRLQIRDGGNGISPRDLPHIFEPFYTTKIMGRSGSGLGMAVVWGTVKDHNGYIDIRSEPGNGTEIAIYFPVTRSAMPGEKGDNSPEEFRGSEHVLVIDDMEEQREIASRILDSLGYKVKTAESGEKAVELCKKMNFDILVLDMIMDPGMDGLETYEAILDIHPGQKAIITSGFSETERVKKSLKLGVSTYLKKPYTFSKLAAAVRAALDSKIS